MKVAGAALNQTPLDWFGNRRRIVEALRLARREQVQVLCLPELCITGYGCEDTFHGSSVAARALDSLKLILPESRGLVAALGLPLIHDEHLFNAVAVLVDGQLEGFAAKKVLANYGVHYEARWFNAWPEGMTATYLMDGQAVPLGDLVFDVGGVRIGFEICEDAWRRGQRGVGEPPRVDLLLNPSASHFAFEKYAILRGIAEEGSRQYHTGYLYTNLVGNEAGRLIFDGTVLIGSNGKIISENERFSFREFNLTTALVDVRANRLERRRLIYPYPHEEDDEGRYVYVDYQLKEPSPQAIRKFRTLSPRPARMPRYEEFVRAVSLGLWDYLRKSRSRGFVVSLSGGVDSASVAVLTWSMVRLALAELGWEGFRDKLAHIPDLPRPRAPLTDPESVRPLVNRLLYTVYQATPNSSAETRAAARALSEQLGARHIEIEVGPLVETYERLAEEALGRKLTWERDDIARQNIQARVRSPGVWLLANLEGLLLLTTSNRSEVGVGYSTMDGDTSGGLAPIAGANKTFLQGWLRWMETDGLPELGPLPALGAINRQAPSAELRPLDRHQKDEEDLMPYPVLDAIEQAAIRDHMTPVEVWRMLLTAPLGDIQLGKRQAAEYVADFFRRWSRSQWKRERLAPSFHLDDENLDPRTWFRFPILAGNYEAELEELWRAVETGRTPGSVVRLKGRRRPRFEVG
ncbi:MAG: NAD(+) synthase [SAR324 cluster bacterium]|nr:NAD(+) synthase [SAR324 cluster bacterium]